MNKTLSLGLLALVAAMFLLPSVSAYPWGPNGPPPGDRCGRETVQFNCGEYYWYCSPSYNESPDICSWRVEDRCAIWVAGCLVR